MKRVIKHIQGLSRDLPTVIDIGHQYGSAGAAPVIEALDNLLSAAKSAAEGLSVRAANWGRTIGKQRYSAPWHDDIVCLACILEEAATKQHKRVSFTKATAPAVAFIDSALTRAGVRHGSPDAIARAMARYKSRTKKRAAPVEGT
jgi:hypothetical protein